MASERWTIYVCPNHGHIPVPTDGYCPLKRCDHSRKLPRIEVIPLSLLEEIAEELEKRADEVAPLPPRTLSSQGRIDTYRDAAFLIRSRLSDSREDG